MSFEGDSYDPKHDAKRLTTQLEAVRALMSDGDWRTLQEIGAIVAGSEAAISARLRDLRKAKFGALDVARRRRGEKRRGLWEYRVSSPEPARGLVGVQEALWA